MQVLSSKISGFMARVFGCWHAELSRPFSRGGARLSDMSQLRSATPV
jgi:hypothetical protein